jgi:enterochelin esterase-like enzyme
MKLKRESLKNGEIFIWMDFAENFTCSAVEEVQSAYWNSEMVTLHTMVIYFPKGRVWSHKSVVTISDVLQHNATMVYSIIKSLIPFIRIQYPELKTSTI